MQLPLAQRAQANRCARVTTSGASVLSSHRAVCNVAIAFGTSGTLAQRQSARRSPEGTTGPGDRLHAVLSRMHDGRPPPWPGHSAERAGMVRGCLR